MVTHYPPEYAQAFIPQSFRTLLTYSWLNQWTSAELRPDDCVSPAKQGKRRVPKKVELPRSLHRHTHTYIHAGTHRSGSQYSDNLDLYPALRFRQLKNSQRRWPFITRHTHFSFFRLCWWARLKQCMISTISFDFPKKCTAFTKRFQVLSTTLR